MRPVQKGLQDLSFLKLKSKPSNETDWLNQMNTQFEKKDDLNAVLTVTIKPEDYKGPVEKQLKDYRKKANIPGFRHGMAPMGMVKKMVGKAILVDEVNNLANKSLFDYLTDNKIHYLGKPVLSWDKKPKADWDSEGEFEFYFELGLAPDFKLNLSDKDKVTRFKIKLDSKEIDKEIDNMKRRYGSLEQIDVTENDQDSVSGTLTELDNNGEPLEGGVEGKETRVLIEMVEDKKTKSALTGLKPGDKVKVNIFKLFKDNEQVIASTLGLPKEGVKDLNKEFELNVTEIQRFIQSPVDQSLFDKVFGEGEVTTEEEFRKRVTENLETYYKSESENMVDHEITHVLKDKHAIQLPDAFLKKWLIEEFPDNYNAENIDEQYGKESDGLRYQLINDKIMEDFKLEVSEDDLNHASLSFTAQQLRQYGMPNPDVETLQYFEKQNRGDQNYLNRVRDMVVNQKVTEQVKSMISIKEKEISVEKFYEHIRKHNEKHNH